MKDINIHVLRICYEQYFCNVCELTDEELLSTHFKFNEALNVDEDIYWDDPSIENLIIWHPMKDVQPTYIFDNILEIHKRIWTLHDEAYTHVCLELASDLAEERVAEYFAEELGENHEYTDDKGDTYLNEDAQDLFNNYYDFYANKINEYFGKEE